jgi:hypothetical protein
MNEERQSRMELTTPCRCSLSMDEGCVPLASPPGAGGPGSTRLERGGASEYRVPCSRLAQAPAPACSLLPCSRAPGCIRPQVRELRHQRRLGVAGYLLPPQLRLASLAAPNVNRRSWTMVWGERACLGCPLGLYFCFCALCHVSCIHIFVSCTGLLCDSYDYPSSRKN